MGGSKAAAGPLGHPGFELRPIVIGPGDIPRIIDAGEARRAPYRAILSALVHAKDAGAEHECWPPCTQRIR